MADITYPPIEETTPFNAESLNSRFSDPAGSVREAINDISLNAIAPGALNQFHFTSGASTGAPTQIFDQLRVGRQGATHTYTRAQTVASSSGYLPFNTAGGAGSGTDLQLSTVSTLDDDGPYSGILVLGDFHLYRVYDPSKAAADRYSVDSGVSVRIEYLKPSSGNWLGINKTIRWVSAQLPTSRAAAPALVDRAQQLKIPIRTLITASDISGGELGGIRAVVRVDYDSVNQTTATAAEFFQCDLACISLLSKKT